MLFTLRGRRIRDDCYWFEYGEPQALDFALGAFATHFARTLSYHGEADIEFLFRRMEDEDPIGEDSIAKA